MMKRILSKASWKDAIGATKKPKRLKLLSHNGLFICPVAYCESEPYRSKRGSRKLVFAKHGCYYYFQEKRSEIEGSQLESGCQLCAVVSSLH